MFTGRRWSPADSPAAYIAHPSRERRGDGSPVFQPRVSNAEHRSVSRVAMTDLWSLASKYAIEVRCGGPWRKAGSGSNLVIQFNASLTRRDD
jgi:hypothetical protein